MFAIIIVSLFLNSCSVIIVLEISTMLIFLWESKEESEMVAHAFNAPLQLLSLLPSLSTCLSPYRVTMARP